jgi:pimeloyl-ACP methyl ester carboxylesterase
MPQQEFSDVYYSAADGLKLHARVYGEASDALPLVCLPGLTRNARDFHELALYLSREAESKRKVVAFDYRGRGGSEYDRNWQNYDVQVETRDIVDGLTALGMEEAAFLGTSRGGLIIFVLTAMRPGAIKAVILNDVGPVLEGAGLAQIQSYLKRAPKPASFAEAVQVQRSANGEAFSALSDADWERMVRALYRDEGGKPVADYDPALANTMKSADFSKPLPVLWPQFDALAGVPVLAIRGANSRLLSAKTLAAMAERHPRLRAITVEGQGHPPLLETGDLPERIAAFLDRVD